MTDLRKFDTEMKKSLRHYKNLNGCSSIDFLLVREISDRLSTRL